MPGRKYSVANTNYRYGFNGQEKSTEMNGYENLYTAEFWEYDSRIGRRWNVDPRPDISMSPYNAFAGNPILFSDPLGDTILPYAVAEKLGRTLKGSNNATDAQKIGDYTVTGVYKANKGMTIGSPIGYQATKDGRIDYEMLPGDIEEFKKNVKFYSNVAELINQAGASDAMRKIGVGIGSDDMSYALQGAKEENKEFWTNPAKTIPTLVAWGHAGVVFVESSVLNNARNSVSTTIRKQKQNVQHTVGGSATVGKSTMNSLSDAQTVLDALHAGKGRVVLVNPSQNRVLFYCNEVQGNFVHQGNSTPSSLFMVKGSAQGATVVPVNPIKMK